MINRVLRFVLLPLVLLLIWALLRFLLGVAFHVPYEPRGNAMFSVVGLMFISCLYFGALSGRVGNFGWLGTLLAGVFIGLWAQILIFTLTVVSLAAGLSGSYYTHWDALNLKPEQAAVVTIPQVVTIRAGGLVIGTILGGVAAIIGRALFGLLAPKGRVEG